MTILCLMIAIVCFALANYYSKPNSDYRLYCEFTWLRVVAFEADNYSKVIWKRVSPYRQVQAEIMYNESLFAY
jgi:hypothetical protein